MSLPRPRTLKLTRRGQIKVRVAGDHHCGAPSVVLDGMVPVQYTVELVVAAPGVDQHGFLVDQEALHGVMLDIGMDPVAWHEPCEQLTYIWGYRLLDWISVANTDCDIMSLDLTLSPAPNAGSFTAHFDVQPVAAVQQLRAVA